MTIADETLMAFADGELDEAQCAAVEAAMRDDPDIQRRVAQHRALRQRLQGAYSAELTEQLPERLLAAARGGAIPRVTHVVDLGEARAALARNRESKSQRSWWRPVGSIAASIAVGLGLGHFVWRETESPLVRSTSGAVIARGELANALSGQLAADQSPHASVHIGVSFVAKSGDYCRTFSMSGAVSPAGLACHRGQEWQVQTLTQDMMGSGNSEYRTAGSALAPTILSSVQEKINGEPLDQAAESAARQRGWKAAAP